MLQSTGNGDRPAFDKNKFVNVWVNFEEPRDLAVVACEPQQVTVNDIFHYTAS